MYPTDEEIQKIYYWFDKLLEADFYSALIYHKDEHGYYYLGTIDWLDEYKSVFPIKYNMGATKICLTLPDVPNWIIKFNFDRSTDKMQPEYRCIDFCKCEFDNYREACELHLNKFFASTYYLGKRAGIPIYIQERLDVDEEGVFSHFIEYSRSTLDRADYRNDDEFEEAYYSRADELDDEDRLIALYDGDPQLHDLIEFAYANDINDLHEGNYGKRDDGSYVIFDFSGFC